ncbi:hypothetical protein TWF481_010965 [Arthrobotrys musiformis]|uniref:Uncharacterized protein n=1 Tax=Arthrobotrys musiformis TaxID=47236 RepID=A0AAV9VX36_9PEZI
MANFHQLILIFFSAFLGYQVQATLAGTNGRITSNPDIPSRGPSISKTEPCLVKPCQDSNYESGQFTDYGPISSISHLRNSHPDRYGVIHEKRADSSSGQGEDVEMEDDEGDEDDEEAYYEKNRDRLQSSDDDPSYDDSDKEMTDEDDNPDPGDDEEAEPDIDDDEEMYDYGGEEFMDDEDPWYVRAMQDGQDNEDLERQNVYLDDRPLQDPEIHTEDQIKIEVGKTRNFNLFDIVGLESFLSNIGRRNIVHRKSYLAIRASDKSSKDAFLTTMISMQDNHMIITREHQALLFGAYSWNLLVSCWDRAREEQKHEYGFAGRVDYVSIEGITDSVTIKQMAIARSKWFRLGDKGGMARGFNIESDSIPFEDQDSRNVWSALRGTTPINAVVRMIQTYPNRFQALKLSTIHILFDTLDDPSVADVFLEFQWPINIDSMLESAARNTLGQISPIEEPDADQDEESEGPVVDQTEERVPVRELIPPSPNVIILDGKAPESAPVLHPLLPDIGRTHYRSPHRPTFKTMRAKYRGTGGETNIYLVACSQVEGELVFRGFENEDYNSAANIAQARDALGDILYAAWAHETRPDEGIKGISFSSLSPMTEDSLGRAFQESGLETIDGVQTVSYANGETFKKVTRVFLQTREGKAIRNLIRGYGQNMGGLSLHTIQYGRHTVWSGFFIYVTLKASAGDAGPDQFDDLSAVEILRQSIGTGIESVIEHLIFQYRELKLIREGDALTSRILRPRYPKLETLLEGLEVNDMYTTPRRRKITFDEPCKDHLIDIATRYPKIFGADMDPAPESKIKAAMDPRRAFEQTVYPAVVIGPKGQADPLPGNANTYTIAAFWDLMHIAVLNIPKIGIAQNSPPLEDILFGAWVKMYGDHSKKGLIQPLIDIKGAVGAHMLYRRRDGAPIRYITFMMVSENTRRIVATLYRWS